MLDEDANFGGHPATGRPHCKDWYRSLKGTQKANDGTFSEFCGEEPRRRLGNPQMFKDAHSHLFNIASSKDSCGDNAFRFLSGAKDPRLHGATLDKDDRSKAVKILRRLRRTVAREVLRSGDENGRRLRESSCHQRGVWKIT